MLFHYSAVVVVVIVIVVIIVVVVQVFYGGCVDDANSVCEVGEEWMREREKEGGGEGGGEGADKKSLHLSALCDVLNVSCNCGESTARHFLKFPKILKANGGKYGPTNRAEYLDTSFSMQCK